MGRNESKISYTLKEFWLILLTVSALCAGCAKNIDTEQNIDYSVPSKQGAEELSIRYFGNTSIYISSANASMQNGIMIDGFISRPNLLRFLLLGMPHYDQPAVCKLLKDENIKEIAAVVPLHSHFDHLLDAPTIAKESNATIVSSPTSCAISKAMGFRVDCHTEKNYLTDQFSVTLFDSTHLDTGIIGKISAPKGAYKDQKDMPDFKKAKRGKHYVEGQSYNVLVKQNTDPALSVFVLAGIPSSTDSETSEQAKAIAEADVLFISVPMTRSLRKHDKSLLDKLLQLMNSNYKKLVIPAHWDKFYKPIERQKCLEANTSCLSPLIFQETEISTLEKEFIDLGHHVTFKRLDAFGEIRVIGR